MSSCAWFWRHSPNISLDLTTWQQQITCLSLTRVKKIITFLIFHLSLKPTLELLWGKCIYLMYLPYLFNFRKLYWYPIIKQWNTPHCCIKEKFNTCRTFFLNLILYFFFTLPWILNIGYGTWSWVQQLLPWNLFCGISFGNFLFVVVLLWFFEVACHFVNSYLS